MDLKDLSRDHVYMILNAIPQIGPISFSRLMAEFDNDVHRILRAEVRELKKVEGIGDMGALNIKEWRKFFDLGKELEKLKVYDGAFISRESDDYPALLKEIYDPPTGLYALGPCRAQLKTIGIVGSRRCTLYGMSVAKKLASELAQMGFCIVSGLARGIDAAAHEGALEVGGQTVAVLGCGADIIYPPENKDLYDEIKKKGAIVSELRFGRQADKMTFPRRNRIVSGMSQAVIVVETNSNGGSMITARLANEQGKHVFAVPGRIDQASSKGCNELIRDGATLVTCAEDILSELNYLRQGELDFGGTVKFKQPLNTPAIDGIEKELYQTLKEYGPLGVDGLLAITGKSIPEISSSLLMLELKKLVIKKADGNFEAN